MLRYKKCYLRPIQESDLELILEWRNSDGIRSMMFTDHIISMDEHMAWYKKVEKNLTKSQHLIFGYQGIPLGQVNITDFDQRNKRCHWGFFIGATNAPRGSGMSMGYMALEYIFETMGMHKICSEALSDNVRSIQYQKKLGFLEEGYCVAHAVKQGNYHDVVCLGLLNKNWHNNKEKLQQSCFEREELK